MSDFFDRIPVSIEFYEEGDLGGLDIKELGEYLQEKTSIPITLRGNIYDGLPKEKLEEVAYELSKIRIKDPWKKLAPGTPFQAERDYEERRIKDPKWKIFGILYEGVFYQWIIRDLISLRKIDARCCNILLTNQLFGTWDRDDLRYHVRASLYGFPHLISVSGVVEAPAKPKEFYFKKQMGLPLELLKEEYRGRYLDHNDSKMTEVLKGYAMQALFFHLIGNPFCEDRDCRLFNSHWQEELIYSQLNGKYEYCPEHEGILKKLKGGSRDNP